MKRITVSKSSQEVDLIEKLEPVLRELGYECRDVEIHTGGQSVVRVLIDAPLDTNGRRAPISVDDCAKVHRILGPMFDVWDPFPGTYSLEMSSAGECPNLRTLEHFQEAVGSELRFQTIDALPVPPPAKPRRKWEGRLESVSSEGVLTVKDALGEYQIPLDKVKNATWLRVWTVQDAKDQEKERL